MKYAFFLGAGASKSCGAPLQGELFRDYFMLRQEKHKKGKKDPYEDNIEEEIAGFFSYMFGINVFLDKLDEVNFPTFEEVLGVIDLALIRKQSFKRVNDIQNDFNSANRLEICRGYLKELMGSLLYDKLSGKTNNHKYLINKLKESGELSECIFLSTNYDILIDNALADLAVGVKPAYAPYYGFDFTNYEIEQNTRRVPLYKLHGSLNWLYCPTCESMFLTMYEKGAIRLIRPDQNKEHIYCPDCNTLREFVIIPPTYFKDYNNFFLNEVWYKAEQDLRGVEKIFFCGYSFPDADMQIKYLLKRIETNRNGQPLQVYVANGYPKKSLEEKSLERRRYDRFFIQNVNYLEEDFDGLIANLPNYL